MNGVELESSQRARRCRSSSSPELAEFTRLWLYSLLTKTRAHEAPR